MAVASAATSAAAAGDKASAAEQWVRCSERHGDKRCHQGARCQNMACAYAHPREWRGFAPSQSAARRGPKRNEVNIVHHDG